MNVPVVMPQLGLTMTEGSISQWLKRPGERVEKGELLFVVSTDKADAEIESLEEGTMAQIVVEPGTAVAVGTVVAYLQKSGGQESATGSTPVGSTIRSSPVTPELKSTARVVKTELKSQTDVCSASPRARRMARKLGVDVSVIQGSGAGGRIVEEDVRKSAEQARAQTVAPAVRHRQLIAERMVQSIRTTPHFCVNVEINAAQLISFLKSLNYSVQKAGSPRLTVTDLLLKTLGVALTETPDMNVVWEEGRCTQRSGADLGLAIATERGVVAPVVHSVDKLELVAVSCSRNELVKKAREGRLSLPDLEGGVGTLSNLGMYRVDHFQALISPGQSFVLALGRIRDRPWVEETTLMVRPTVYLSLSVDHRVADGAVAVGFLGKIADIIENPFQILWSSSISKDTGGSKT